jgi:hypothetical protein
MNLFLPRDLQRREGGESRSRLAVAAVCRKLERFRVVVQPACTVVTPSGDNSESNNYELHRNLKSPYYVELSMKSKARTFRAASFLTAPLILWRHFGSKVVSRRGSPNLSDIANDVTHCFTVTLNSGTLGWKLI